MISNNETQNRSTSTQNNLVYFLVGGGIGAAVALLFAPKPGKELRQDASEAVKQGLETANKTVTQLRESAGDYYHKAQDKASSLYQVAVKTVNDGTDVAKEFANRTLDRVKDQAGQIAEETGEMGSELSPISEYEQKGPFDQRTPKTGIL